MILAGSCDYAPTTGTAARDYKKPLHKTGEGKDRSETDALKAE